MQFLANNLNFLLQRFLYVVFVTLLDYCVHFMLQIFNFVLSLQGLALLTIMVAGSGVDSKQLLNVKLHLSFRLTQVVKISTWSTSWGNNVQLKYTTVHTAFCVYSMAYIGSPSCLFTSLHVPQFKKESVIIVIITCVAVYCISHEYRPITAHYEQPAELCLIDN